MGQLGTYWEQNILRQITGSQVMTQQTYWLAACTAPPPHDRGRQQRRPHGVPDQRWGLRPGGGIHEHVAGGERLQPGGSKKYYGD